MHLPWKIDSYLSGILLVAAANALAIGGLLISRRIFRKHDLISTHEVGGFLLSVVGTMYAVILGLIVVDAMTRLSRARRRPSRRPTGWPTSSSSPTTSRPRPAGGSTPRRHGLRQPCDLPRVGPPRRGQAFTRCPGVGPPADRDRDRVRSEDPARAVEPRGRGSRPSATSGTPGDIGSSRPMRPAGARVVRPDLRRCDNLDVHILLQDRTSPNPCRHDVSGRDDHRNFEPLHGPGIRVSVRGLREGPLRQLQRRRAVHGAGRSFGPGPPDVGRGEYAGVAPPDAA